MGKKNYDITLQFYMQLSNINISSNRFTNNIV